MGQTDARVVRPADPISKLTSGNKAFSKRFAETSPDLLKSLGSGQSPEVLWIGCADSRIPETLICDCQPGDIFVHRNIANVLRPDDVNSQSVIEFSVGALGVSKIVVCGHTKCGGANAALGDADLGPTLNNWLGTVRDLRKKHAAELDKLSSADEKANRLAEINVQNSVDTLKRNATVQKAIKEKGLVITGVIYDIPAAELKVLDKIDTTTLPALD